MIDDSTDFEINESDQDPGGEDDTPVEPDDDTDLADANGEPTFEEPEDVDEEAAVDA